MSRRVQVKWTRHDAQVSSPQRQPAVGVRPRGEWKKLMSQYLRKGDMHGFSGGVNMHILTHAETSHSGLVQ